MENLETLIDAAIENGIEVEQRVVDDEKNKKVYDPLPEGVGTHLQVTFSTALPITRSSMALLLHPHRTKYGIVKHFFRQKNATPTKRHVTLIMRKNAHVAEKMRDFYVTHAVKIMNHVETLIRRSIFRTKFTVIFNDVPNLNHVCVHPDVLLLLHKAFATTCNLCLLQSDIYFLCFSIY